MHGINIANQSSTNGGEPSSWSGWGKTPICCPSLDRRTAVPSLEVVTMPPMPDTVAMERMGPPWSSMGSPSRVPVDEFQNRNLPYEQRLSSD